jgi:hypothetical protein
MAVGVICASTIDSHLERVMNFRPVAFPYSPHPKPLSLLNFVHTEKGRGMRAKSA